VDLHRQPGPQRAHLAHSRRQRTGNGWLTNNGVPDITVSDFNGKGPAGTSPRLLRGHDTVTDLA
jgi:hypothetical protein